MFVQGIPDPRSRSFNLLIAAPASQTSAPASQPSAPVRKYTLVELQSPAIKLSPGAKAFRLQ